MIMKENSAIALVKLRDHGRTDAGRLMLANFLLLSGDGGARAAEMPGVGAAPGLRRPRGRGSAGFAAGGAAGRDGRGLGRDRWRTGGTGRLAHGRARGRVRGPGAAGEVPGTAGSARTQAGVRGERGHKTGGPG